MIINKIYSHKRLYVKVIVTNDYKFSNNIDEVIRSVLKFLFFLMRRFHKYKKHKKENKALKAQSIY